MKILVVDDEPTALLVFQSALQSLHYEVVSATDGEKAWEALAADRTLRVVLCDWLLPRLDGLGLCRRVREHREDYISFILITQLQSSDENIEEALAAGVDAFLTKPLAIHQLRLCLHVAERILGFTSEIRQLQEFLPICSYCKKIRDDHNYWQQLEAYFEKNSGTHFSHGVCPECYQKYVLPELESLRNSEKTT